MPSAAANYITFKNMSGLLSRQHLASSFERCCTVGRGSGWTQRLLVAGPVQRRRWFVSNAASPFASLESLDRGASEAQNNDSRPRKRTVIPGFANHPGFVIVPQQTAYVVERLGRFRTILSPGFHFLIPLIDRVAYLHSLKEEAIAIPNQHAITKDNVTIEVDGVLYLRVDDAYHASYGVENPIFAVTQLAQTTMRSELGKLSLDDTFLERESLNAAITSAINVASLPWGMKCMRYEIKDIIVPPNIRIVMERQAEAERSKRAEILQSEGVRESEINISQGRKQAVILQAQGEAEAVRQRAQATAAGLRIVAAAIDESGGVKAVTMQLAEQYVDALSKLAKEGTTMVVPANVAEPASMLAQALGIFKRLDHCVSGSLGMPQPKEGSVSGMKPLAADTAPA